MTGSELISVSSLQLRRGERELFAGASQRFCAGEAWWIQGENGRGKTSLLRILAGLLTPEAGELRWRGQSFASRLDESGQAISLLDERLGLSRDLSVEDNLRFAGGIATGRFPRIILERLDLVALRHRPVRELSTGQKKRVALARLLAEDAPVWLLDEPANGLDTANRHRLAALMQTHVENGGLCIFASHDALPLPGAQLKHWVLDA